MSIRLKLLRKKLGVTLEALAEKSGMTKSYLSKVERGLNTPSIAAALKLAKALNVKVEELFSEDSVSLDSYSLVRSHERPETAPGYAVLAIRSASAACCRSSFIRRQNSATRPSRSIWGKSFCLCMKAGWKWTS
jgi:transcriptional regulator with XRE-family HTH domain